jgi:hypothetical protein
MNCRDGMQLALLLLQLKKDMLSAHPWAGMVILCRHSCMF